MKFIVASCAVLQVIISSQNAHLSCVSIDYTMTDRLKSGARVMRWLVTWACFMQVQVPSLSNSKKGRVPTRKGTTICDRT